ncbi:MAG: hemolysin family protein [Simkaniaceae bacterium]|nr:hemolysin family protein [Simkaniaceae bacterium]MCF7851712.1 hemolysin family protein [Simkaniaceae bacterium]
MWIDNFLLPAIFLVASSTLYAIRLSLENMGLLACRRELATHPKYYSLYQFILKLDKESPWKSLFDFLRLTTQITRLFYTVTCTIFFLKQASGTFGYYITSEKLEVTLLWVIVFFFVILFFLLILDFLFSLISRSNPVFGLRFFNWFGSIFILFFSPITYLVTKIGVLLKKRGSLQEEMNSLKIKDKLLELVQETEIKHLLSPIDRKLLISVASFQERIVREVMIPRIDMFSVSANRTVYECMQEFIQQGYSRIPVFEDDIDHIMGILLYKDLLTFYANSGGDINLSKKTTIKEFVKPAIFTPETKKISHLLQEFKTKQFHLAIVVDEYGGTEGIITIEDILEELVGEIEDEYDSGDEKAYVIQPDGGWIVDGKMTIIDIEQNLKISIPSTGEYETIGGYIFHRSGSIPKKGWRLHHDDFYIEVVKSDEKSIDKVRIIPTLNEKTASNEELL